jgi:hypothetical protein
VNFQAQELEGETPRKGGRRVPAGPASKEPLRLRLYVGLILVDVTALFLGFAFANILRFGSPFDAQGMNMWLVLLPIYLGTALNSRAYGMDVLILSRRGMFRAVSSLIFALAAVTFLAFYLRSSMEMSRIALGVGAIVAAGLIVVGRKLLGLLSDRWCGGSPLSEVVIKDGQDCAVAPGAFVVDAQATDLRPDIGDPLMLDRIGRLLKNADRVVVACSLEARGKWRDRHQRLCRLLHHGGRRRIAEPARTHPEAAARSVGVDRGAAAAQPVDADRCGGDQI